MSLFPLISQGFLLGLALSPTCLGVCLPLLVPYFGAEERTTRANWKAFAWFLLGRLAGYTGMGLLAGWLGQEILFAPHTMRVVEGSVSLGMGLLLVVYAVSRSFPHWSWCAMLHGKVLRERTPGMMGLLTGITICPPFVAVLFDAARSGGPVNGAVVLGAFFIGTSLILLPLPVLGILAKEKAMQTAGKVAAGMVGVWLMLKGAGMLL